MATAEQGALVLVPGAWVGCVHSLPSKESWEAAG